jgi:hypothetical protein
MAALLKIDSHHARVRLARRHAQLVLAHPNSMPPCRPPAKRTLVMRWTVGTDGRLAAKWIFGAPNILRFRDD